MLRIIKAIPYLIISLLTFTLACRPTEKEKDTELNSAVSVHLPNAPDFLPSWSKNDEVIVQIAVDPDNMHPTNGTSLTRLEINQYIHSSLLLTDLRTSELTSGICEAMPIESENHLSMTFKLRNELRWDDGSCVTAKDVIFTTKASICPLTENPAMKSYFQNIEDIKADPLDSLKFTITMKKPYIQNLILWSDYPIIQQAFYDSSNILQKYSMAQLTDTLFNTKNQSEIKQWAEKFNSSEYGFDISKISGMGPYKIIEWEQGNYIKLKRKENHWTKNSSHYNEYSYPTYITFKLNRDPLSQTLAFQSQEFDGSSTLGTRTLIELSNDSNFNKNYNYKFMNTYGYTYIAINTKPDGSKRLPLLTDANVRRALAHLTPVQDIINVVNKGVNQPVNGPVAPMKKSYNNELPLIDYNINKAAELLKAAGWKDSDNDGVLDKIINGKKLKLEIELAYLTTQPEWKEMATLVSESMAKCGVKANAIPFEFPIWNEKSTNRDFDMLMGSWNSSSMPDDYEQLWSTNSWLNGGQNFTGFGNEISDQLIDSINHTLNYDKRIILEKKLQKLIYDEQPYIFMYGLVRRCVIHKRFANAEFYAERPGILYNILHLPSKNAVSSSN
jgi:peptide/nickel transport system substrate-binding protein